MRGCTSFVLSVWLVGVAGTQTTHPWDEYHIYAGNTHSHTSFTWSHGEQWENDKGEEGKGPAIERTADGSQLPGKSKVLPIFTKTTVCSLRIKRTKASSRLH